MSEIRAGLVRDLFARTLLKRGLADRQDLLPVWFEAGVLERYREGPYEIMRTDSAGRLKLAGVFSLDFGLPAGGGVIHVSLAALGRLPEKERVHFLDHLVAPPLSVPFLQMQYAPGSCFDDGNSRPYFGGD